MFRFLHLWDVNDPKDSCNLGLKYDAVFVDVAYAAVNRTMAAPVDEFFLFETVQQVRNILKDKGTIMLLGAGILNIDSGVLVMNTYTNKPPELVSAYSFTRTDHFGERLVPGLA